MNVSKLLNKKLNNIKLQNPIVFTYNIDWKNYQNFKNEQYQHVKKSLEKNNIDVELLPILTDHRSDLDARVKQFSRGLSRICDKYQGKAHIVAYSLAGLHARAFVSFLDGQDFIKTLTTVGSPNKY